MQESPPVFAHPDQAAKAADLLADETSAAHAVMYNHDRNFWLVMPASEAHRYERMNRATLVHFAPRKETSNAEREL